jgi:SIR2-like domain
MRDSNGPSPRHFSKVAKAILRGHVVPVLGAGANLCDRQQSESFHVGANLPNGRELSEYLAVKFDCEIEDDRDLLRVSQAAVLDLGDGPVFEELRHVFVHEFQPTSLHTFLARIPALMAERGLPVRPQLIVSTNYDDLLERTFEALGEPYDLVYYLGQGDAEHHHQGKFVHVTPDGDRHIIDVAKEYVAVTPSTQTVILKVHGAARQDEREDSWVITEDHYIDYLTRTNLSELVPVKLLEKLLNTHFLFLGYAMKDWNLRVILHRIWTQRDHGWQSWAVQLDPDPVDEAFWEEKGVDIEPVPLSSYVAELQACLETVTD